MASSDVPEIVPASDVNPNLVRQFRQQIHALGALWIFFGLPGAMLATFLLVTMPDMDAREGRGQQAFMIFVGVIGICWFILGVLTCLKRIWAVYVGLGVSYIAFVGQVLSINLIALAIQAIVILQAHRVIGWARQMRAAGIPLTTKPK